MPGPLHYKAISIPFVSFALASLVLIAGGCTTQFDQATDTGNDATAADSSLDDGTTPDMPDVEVADSADAPDSSDTHTDTASDTHVDTAGDVFVDPVTDTSVDLADTTDLPVTDGPAPCTHEGFTPAIEQAMRQAADYVIYQAQNTSSTPYDVLTIELYYGYGDPPPLTAPGTFTLAATPQEQNYATCGTCVAIRTSFGGSTFDKMYFTTSGILELEEIGDVGGRFAGTLTGVTMEEVTLNPATFESTPVPGGEGWCIERYDFAATITVP